MSDQRKIKNKDIRNFTSAHQVGQQHQTKKGGAPSAGWTDEQGTQI
jgi:hypothetical protein